MGRVSIGGQAVIEGVMMKNADKYAIAVRKPDKEIIVDVKDYVPAANKVKILKLPILRGIFNFVESMVIGMKTLTFSAEFYEDEEELESQRKKEEKRKKKIEKIASKKNISVEEVETDLKAKEERKLAKKKNKNGSKDGDTSKDDSDGFLIFCTVAFSIVMAIGIFMLIPSAIASLIDKFVPMNYVVLGLIEGIIRLLIFMVYIWLISKMEDIKRTFMYHGAEHKTINCLEAGKDLTVDNVMESSRFHKRCGTSFLFIVMLVSILVFMCIRTDTIILRMAYRILLVPVVAGISYEFIRFAGKSDSAFANMLSKPGLLIQRFTTLEPTPDMVEVAIKSVEGVLDWKEYLENERKNNK